MAGKRPSLVEMGVRSGRSNMKGILRDLHTLGNRLKRDVSGS